MKKNLPNLLIFIFIFLIFKNYSLVLTSTTEAVNIWLTKVFPYLFIMIFCNDLLINLGIINYFSKPSHYIFIMSLLSGSPTSAYIINSLYQNNILTKEEANLNLVFTYFGNPLFLYAFFNMLFHNYLITFKLMFIHYISNFIIYLFYKRKLTEKKLTFSKANFKITDSLKKAMNTLMMVLGTIVLFFIISNILIKSFHLQGIKALLIKGLLEVTQGLNYLLDFKIALRLKEIIAIIFVSFGGLAIHMQIKCFLDESNLDYKYFLKGRIMQVILATILTAIT